MPRPAWIMCAHGNVAAQRLCNCRLACTHPAFIINLTTQSEMTHTSHTTYKRIALTTGLLWWRHQNMAPVPSVQQKLATNCMNEWSELKNEMWNIFLGSKIHGLNASLETHALSRHKSLVTQISNIVRLFERIKKCCQHTTSVFWCDSLSILW